MSLEPIVDDMNASVLCVKVSISFGDLMSLERGAE